MSLSYVLSQEHMIFQIALILLIGIVLTFTQSYLVGKLRPRLEKVNHMWDLALIRSLDKPLLVLIWALVVMAILPLFFTRIGLDVLLSDYVNPTREMIFVICVSWGMMRFISTIESTYQDRISTGEKEGDKTTVRAVSQLCRVVLFVIVSLILLQTMGLRITSLLAFGGVGGIAVGFAAKDTIANFLGGMMIYWDRPFSVGDWVRSPDREIEGIVEHIGWRLTCIRTPDQRPLYVPNGTFSTISIENPSRMTNRRINTTVGLRYEDALKIKPIVADIESMIRRHVEVDHKLPIIVNLTEFGSSSLNILIYAFTKVIDRLDFQAVQQDIFLKIIDIIAAHGAECAFPSCALYLPEPLTVRQENGDKTTGLSH